MGGSEKGPCHRADFHHILHVLCGRMFLTLGGRRRRAM